MEKIKDSMQRRLVSWGMLLVIFFSSMGLVFWRLIKDNDDLVRVTLVQVIALVLLMVWATAKEGIKFRKNPLNIPILIYVGANALTLLVTSNIYESWAAFFKIAIYALIFFLIANNFKIRDVRRSVVAITAMGLLMSVIGLLQYFGMDWFRFLYQAASAGRVFSILGNPDFLGGYLAIILPFAAAILVIRGLRGNLGIFAAASFSAILICLFLTATRSALVAFVGSFVFLSIAVLCRKGMKKVKMRWAYVILACLAVFIIMGLGGQGRSRTFLSRFSTLFKPDALKADSAVQYRLSTWRTSLLMFKDKPFLGEGTGVFKLHYPLYQAKLRQLHADIPFFASQESRVHNEYLQSLAETGIIGTAAFLWLFACVFYCGFKYLSRLVGVWQKILIAGLLASVSAMMLDSMFAFPFHLVSHSVVLWVSLGILVVTGEAGMGESRGRKERVDGGGKPKLSPGRRKGVKSGIPWEYAAGIWAACIVFIIFSTRSFMGTYYYKQAITYGNRGFDDMAKISYEKAMGLSPNEPDIHYTVGTICLNNNQGEMALEELKKVEGLYPYNEGNLLDLGVIYNSRGLTDTAMEYFRKAIFINPGIAQAYFNIAAVHLNHHSGSPWAMEEASRYFIKAAELEPGNEYYRQAMERIAEKKK